MMHRDPKDRSTALINFIFDDKNDSLEYVNSATLVANQTLLKRQANCLSLTILAYSLANALGFDARFQDVEVPEYWITRSGNSLLNGHVNLVVNPDSKFAGVGQIVYRRNSFLIDFDRVPSRSKLKTTEINRNAIISMFYNNKAADAMLVQNDDLAYQYLKAAIHFAPELSGNWNNLAVLYRQKQLFSAAEQVYLHSLVLEPNHTNTMANLAMLYRMTGRPEQAVDLEAKVAKKRLSNPFYFVMLGNEAFERQDADTALHHYRQSLRLQPNTPEALFGMARGYLLKGDLTAASRYLQSAKKSVEPGAERRRYQSKLDLLNAIAKQV
ncbi:MAG: tetratricopeptide repeat protein [Gammaproteobacteria bacterium]|nr:tetratricopeptide repeat protein [Gammaproteobacteria bacterium]